MTRKILIIGATSAIAAACARLWAESGAEFFLAGRNRQNLELTSSDLLARGAADVHVHLIDVNDFEMHAELLDKCCEQLGAIDIALIAHGTLPDQEACQSNVGLTLKEFSVNGLSVIALLTLLANVMEKQSQGTIAVISSVAGDRGRMSNYVYGSAKAAVTTFAEGLRGRLYKSGVHVLTIKPGFVDTPMTRSLKLPALLVASADSVATSIDKAIRKQSNTVYIPWFWRFIMMIIKSIPDFIFKRLSL